MSEDASYSLSAEPSRLRLELVKLNTVSDIGRDYIRRQDCSMRRSNSEHLNFIVKGITESAEILYQENRGGQRGAGHECVSVLQETARGCQTQNHEP